MVRNEYGKEDLEIANNARVLNSFGPKIKQSPAPKLASKPHYHIQHKKENFFHLQCLLIRQWNYLRRINLK